MMMHAALNDNTKSIWLNGLIYLLEWNTEDQVWVGDLLVEFEGRDPEFMAFWLGNEAVTNLEVF